MFYESKILTVTWFMAARFLSHDKRAFGKIGNSLQEKKALPHEEREREREREKERERKRNVNLVRMTVGVKGVIKEPMMSWYLAHPASVEERARSDLSDGWITRSSSVRDIIEYSVYSEKRKRNKDIFHFAGSHTQYTHIHLLCTCQDQPSHNSNL